MLPQAQECGLNIEPCTSCGEKLRYHITTGKEIQTETKTKPPTQSILWQPQNIYLHIKRKNPKT
jgi:hypothetical protein